MNAAASSAGVVNLWMWVVIKGKLGSADAMHLSWEQISGCALEHGKMKQVETKSKATHWADAPLPGLGTILECRDKQDQTPVASLRWMLGGCRDGGHEVDWTIQRQVRAA
jgi:hypothetical protein